MKKRMLGLMLAIVMIFANVMSVAAAETVSEDPIVQEAYTSYVEMVEAFNVNEYGPMKDAYDVFNAATGSMTDEQSEEWEVVVETYIGMDEFGDKSITVATIIYTVELEEAYQADPNAKTALEFVEYYEACVEYGVNMPAMVPGIQSVYETAKEADMPSENVVKVYDAYVAVANALSLGWYDEDFVNVCAGFESVLDIFNELTEEELADLADLMGLGSADEAWNEVFTDWVNANLVLQIGEVWTAFDKNPGAETAQAYVEAYENVSNDTSGFLTDEDKAVILAFFSEDSYEDAKTYLTEDDNKEDNNKEESDDQTADVPETETPVIEESESSPKTGDEANVMITFAVMMASAAMAAVILKRRNAA